MRILHVAHSIERKYGGPTESMRGYARAARTLGATTSIAAPAASSEDRRRMEEASGAGTVFLFESFGRNAGVFSPSLQEWVRCRAREFDVVHVHGLFNPISTLAARASITACVPTVVRPFGTLSRYTAGHRRGLLKRAWFALLEQSNLRHAAAIHFTTEGERTEAEWRGESFGSRAFIIPPPFRGGGQPTFPRGSRSAVVGCMARLHPVKNIESLIDAWDVVRARVPDARLVIAGSGDPAYANTLKSRANRLKHPDSIEFRGFVTGVEKARLLQESTHFVLPSLHENFGVVILEALSAGLPIILSREVQLAPFIEEHGVGVVTPSNPADLANAIVEAIENDELRKRAARTGYELVQRYFGEDIVGAKLIAMYEAAAAALPS